MSYRSLYRKWRPLKFNELVGQEHITKTLKNAILRSNISHAYLFCGPRGTGKTTVAKILARAANCTELEEAEPCGKCSSCLNIIAGSSMDVFELDAASNRGIDEMRDLKEKTRYMASEGRFKVYIIDEAHMLTNEAFNALLKTLEEPPPGVIFVMATTDPSKLPPTVVSRCQRLDFRLLTVSEVESRIRHVASAESWPFEEAAIPLIARLSEGAMRDALGFLEQVYAFGEGRVTADNVYDLAGMTREETLGQIIDALSTGDVSGGLSAIRDVAFGGKDLQLFLKEQMQFFKNLLIFTAGKESDGDYERYHKYLKKYKNNFSGESLLQFINLLSDAASKLRLSEHAHFILEITFLNMLNEMQRSPLQHEKVLEKRVGELELMVNELRERIKRIPSAGEFSPVIEAKQKNDYQIRGKDVVASQGSGYEPDRDEGASVSGMGEDEDIREEVAEPLSGLAFVWQEILGIILKNKQISTHALLQMLHPESLEEGLLTLSYSSGHSFLKEKLEEPGRKSLVHKVAGEVTGNKIDIKLVERVVTGEKAHFSAEDTVEEPKDKEAEDIVEEPEDKETPETGKFDKVSGDTAIATDNIGLENNKTGYEDELTEENPISVLEGSGAPVMKATENEATEKAKDGESREIIRRVSGVNSDFIINEAIELFNGKLIEN